MSEPRPSVLLLQCLCPARHCVLAFAGEAPPATVESMTAAARAGVEAAIAAGKMRPVCALCQAPRELWSFEVAELPDHTLAEVLPALQQQEAEQIAMQARMKAEARAARN